MPRRGIKQRPVYRREDGTRLIELELRELSRLFHHLDPAPFREKDLDPAAEEYIVEAFRDLSPEGTPKLVVHLPESEAASEEARTLPEAIAHYFDYRAGQTRIALHTLLKRGAASLAIGLVFLFTCLSLRRALVDASGYEMFAEGLLIIGWVALWRPVEIFLYDWWPIYQRQRRFMAIARMPIETRSGPQARQFREQVGAEAIR